MEKKLKGNFDNMKKWSDSDENDLIIGAFTGYNFDIIKPWVDSIDSCGFKGEKVVIVGQTTEETIKELTNRNFKIVPTFNLNVPIHVSRFISIYDYLKDNWKKYRYIVTTDVRDVYFQTNPMEWLENNLKDKKMVAGSESLLYKDEPWGDDNLLRCYGQYVYDIFKNNEIYNVGTLGGTSEYIKDLVFNIFTNSLNRPIPIVDQAVFNVLIQTQPYKDIILFAKQKYGWACQAGTTADPSKMAKFRPNLLEEEPIYKNGKILTSTGKEFCIVHQYDRVPEWKRNCEKMFNTNIKSQYDKDDDVIVINTGV